MRSASARSLRLRAASPPPLAIGSPPARGEEASGTPRSANSRRFLVSSRARESLSVSQKPSAEARAGGARPTSGAATPPASVSFLGGGGGFFCRTICSREWPNLGLTPAGEWRSVLGPRLPCGTASLPRPLPTRRVEGALFPSCLGLEPWLLRKRASQSPWGKKSVFRWAPPSQYHHLHSVSAKQSKQWWLGESRIRKEAAPRAWCCQLGSLSAATVLIVRIITGARLPSAKHSGQKLYPVLWFTPYSSFTKTALPTVFTSAICEEMGDRKSQKTCRSVAEKLQKLRPARSQAAPAGLE